MYIDLVRRVLEQAVEGYAANSGKTISEILTKIREHIDATAREHRRDEPAIAYHEALCRLGYLYRHATANATLFERVLRESGDLRTVLRQSFGKRLNIFAVGGGPGTELLGLAKYLLHEVDSPKKIVFTVLDNVPQWAETWQQLADAVESEFQNAVDSGDLSDCPTIVPVFLPLDVLKGDSYTSYEYQFRSSQIIIFNYLFSENKTRLSETKKAVRRLHEITPPGCVFVVIDRLENLPIFKDEVVAIFDGVFGKGARVHEFNGTLDSDEQVSEMGELQGMLGSPRIKFFTDIYRDPTVFWFTMVKG